MSEYLIIMHARNAVLNSLLSPSRYSEHLSKSETANSIEALFFYAHAVRPRLQD